MVAPSQPPPSNRSRYSSGTYAVRSTDAQADRVAELISELAALHPGIAKTKPSQQSMDEADICAEKRRWIDLRESLGLSRRAAARLLDLAPATIDGWEHMGDLSREPKPSVFARLPRLVADMAKATGT